MNLDFIFFKDHSLLQEIRKHKWIESEKAGCEIGFATAACDWMQKYYATWSKYAKPQKSAVKKLQELVSGAR